MRKENKMPNPDPKQTAPPTEIKISITESGGFAYSMSTHLMTRSKGANPKARRVVWKADGPFVVDFGDRSPFKRLIYKNRDKGTFESETAEVVEGVDLGRYRYAVAVFDPKRNELFLDACPEVVIEC
jgi:hypothetical protein